MAKRLVRITPAVLDWAINSSGFTVDALAAELDVQPGDLLAWSRGETRPRITEVRKLAAKLHRPVAAFFLPRPPAVEPPPVEFRHAPGTPPRGLNPIELRYMRRALRLQRVLEWLSEELDEAPPTLPAARIGDSPDDSAERLRGALQIPVETQVTWASDAVAFDAWREALERVGVLVFLFSMGKDSVRGFSLWSPRAPVIAINTHWNEHARIYSLFHECGHLVTRTNSACAEGLTTPSAGDPAERWCEQFAAVVVLPRAAVLAFIRSRGIAAPVHDLAPVRALANRFHVSLRAATIRLIELGFTDWNFYRELPAASDAKSRGGGGGGGRDVVEVRSDQLGSRTASMFHRAVAADLVSRPQALEYLDVPDAHFDQLGDGR